MEALGVIVAVLGLATAEANRHADIAERRAQFTRNFVDKMSKEGFNVVIVAGRSRAMGDYEESEQYFEGKTYTIYTVPKGKPMIVQNRDDGGDENWALQGLNWVRWGKIVKFHEGKWNERTMGSKYEVRPQKDFPGWSLGS
ncbi:hypothetical protein AA313_de0208803 [Arthrobotrys entomopaga]|nr:hypothetical protein AA313_de0208803 [Arthrobotrys entomopaga]